jgi:hypothetical protein
MSSVVTLRMVKSWCPFHVLDTGLNTRHEASSSLPTAPLRRSLLPPHLKERETEAIETKQAECIVGSVAQVCGLPTWHGAEEPPWEPPGKLVLGGSLALCIQQHHWRPAVSPHLLRCPGLSPGLPHVPGTGWPHESHGTKAALLLWARVS